MTIREQALPHVDLIDYIMRWGKTRRDLSQEECEAFAEWFLNNYVVIGVSWDVSARSMPVLYEKFKKAQR